jgi:membrane associated rhomboid family serine protease
VNTLNGPNNRAGIVFGMIPLFTEEGVSWEYHLGGFIAGNVFAFAFAAHKRRKHNQGQITVPPV